MAIEYTGPGGISNSYGQRKTRQPSRIADAGKPHPFYWGMAVAPQPIVLGAPSQVAMGEAHVRNTTARVFYAAPLSEGASPITSYTATSSPGGLTGTVTGSKPTPIIVTGLTPGVNYTFTVVANNAQGASTPSAQSNVVVAQAAPVVNLVGGTRLRGNSQVTTGATGINTGHFKIEAEAPFTQVRVVVGNKYNSGTNGVWSAIVGVTDKAAVDTVNNAYLPQVGGVVNNAVVSSGNGWRAVTWDGGQPTKELGPASASTNSANYMHSDWIDLASIAATDSATGRPMALLRLEQTVANGGFTQAGAGATQYLAARNTGKGWFREYMTNKQSNGGVTNVALVPANVTSVGSEPYAWLEFRHVPAVRSVVVIGDSREESAAADFTLNSWVRVALGELSTPSKPIAHTNLSGSGHSQTQYIALLNNFIAQGGTFTDIVMPGFSQNGFTQSDAGADTFIAANRAVIDAARAAGARVWLTTDYFGPGYTGVSEAARQKCITAAKTLAQQGLVILVDTDPIITDYVTNPTQPTMKAQYNTAADGVSAGDGVHTGPAGQRAMSDLLKSVWNANP